MNNYPVVKGAAYTLAATPSMVIYNGTTQTTERVVNPSSEYLVELPKHLRSYEDVVNYIPNQVYIGNATYDDLGNTEFPYYDKKWDGAKEDGKFGCILGEAEFYGIMHICDVFELVMLETSFAEKVKDALAKRDWFTDEQLESLLKNNTDAAELKRLVDEEHSEGLYINQTELVGVVKRAHDVDVNLSAHVMLENLVSKASNVVSLIELKKKNNFDPASVEYVIDCCEEACGDMNQRGGGNFAKAAAEIAGYPNATGSDVRGFCAGPAHAMLHAAALVKAGTFKNVVVTAGGCTAKLGMNGKDHVKKGLPILEDCIAGFSVLVSADDGVNPIIRTDIVGRHTISTGSAPQKVIGSLVGDPLKAAGLKITDIDKFAPELQNPDITKPAGAGDVPEANYKMIAALAVMNKELDRAEIANFVKQHGMTGWAPTQGHIPSGVPYLGPVMDDIKSGKVKKAMIIGKGSLFLGRMTNLFDGVSFVVEANPAGAGKSCCEKKEVVVNKTAGFYGTKIAFASEGSEHGQDNIDLAVELAAAKGIEAIVSEGSEAHHQMEAALADGTAKAAVTMHYPFPIGVSTVGKVVTPARGKAMYIANTTGTSDTDRVNALVKNAIAGIIAAKADGVQNPTVGIANIDGARACEKILKKLKDNGFDINFAESARADGGVAMRGNDLLMGTADVMVMDSLTGNLMMKMFSSYTTGGQYEAMGYGYGPGIGEGYDKLIMIVSRASGAPVIAGAMEYAANLVANDWKKIADETYAAAHKAGLDDLLKAAAPAAAAADEAEEDVPMPAKEVVTAAIPGIEVMDIDNAVKALWKEGIYAEGGMGCTGPIVQISEANKEKAVAVLTKAGYIG
ncbi:MAG: glycine/sarcosine/betaine reductase complex component C subunit beta [Eubacteriales bacterium]|nr:glycine/sarcosine/betaine reductase complex component C subunit beta [Eubacteriales bacterium]